MKVKKQLNENEDYIFSNYDYYVHLFYSHSSNIFK